MWKINSKTARKSFISDVASGHLREDFYFLHVRVSPPVHEIFQKSRTFFLQRGISVRSNADIAGVHLRVTKIKSKCSVFISSRPPVYLSTRGGRERQK